MAAGVSDEAFARTLENMGAVTFEQLEAARAAQAESAKKGQPVTLADVLVQQGAIPRILRDNLARKLLARQGRATQQLGVYKLLRRIGEGGMGAVYLADDTSTGRQVAVKVLPKRCSEDRELLTRFRREAQATLKLKHPNIVSAYAVGEEMGLHYYAMEYCEGEALEKILQHEDSIKWDKAVEVVIQVVHGLKYAHDHGIIHRDIKPANIFVCTPRAPAPQVPTPGEEEAAASTPSAAADPGAQGSVTYSPAGAEPPPSRREKERDVLAGKFVAKILDLGLSKDIYGTEQSFYTQRGMALGTPHYISPEQALGVREIDGRTDIYSLGATLYHLVTGQTPFDGQSAGAIIAKHLTEQLPNPQDLREDIPDGVVHVIQKMMAKDPPDRYRDCKALLADLELVLAGKAPSSVAIDIRKSTVGMRGALLPQWGERRRER
ncbi:MAG: serine/threonine-protein kinase, partial [Planctomycetota bacterium]